MSKKVAWFLFATFLLVIFGCGGGGGGGSTPPPSNGLSGITVRFLDAGGGVIAAAVTDVNGNYSASVPTDARFVTVDPNTINSQTHFRSFTYLTKRYSPLIAGCAAPLPTLPALGSITLADIRVPSTVNPPPPPPDGCSQAGTGTGSGSSATVSGRVVEGS